MQILFQKEIKDKQLTPELITKAISLCGGYPQPYYKTGSDWGRIFINDSNGTSIGRILFKNDLYDDLKYYKKDQLRELDSGDLIFFRLAALIRFGVLYSEEAFNNLAIIAEDIVEKDFKEKLLWREANPVTRKVWNKKKGIYQLKSRKKLWRRNLRMALKNLMMQSAFHIISAKKAEIDE
jgi:hypothetical protein